MTGDRMHNLAWNLRYLAWGQTELGWPNLSVKEWYAMDESARDLAIRLGCRVDATEPERDTVLCGYRVTRDGVTVATFDREADAVRHLLAVQPHSMAWAMRWEGWDILTPSGESVAASYVPARDPYRGQA